MKHSKVYYYILLYSKIYKIKYIVVYYSYSVRFLFN